MTELLLFLIFVGLIFGTGGVAAVILIPMGFLIVAACQRDCEIEEDVND